jgi:hypothetical protein
MTRKIAKFSKSGNPSNQRSLHGEGYISKELRLEIT